MMRRKFLAVFFSVNIMSFFIQGSRAGMSIGSRGQRRELPTFATAGRTFRVVTSDTVVLPCDVYNIGSYLLAWKKGIAILTAGNIKVSPDERFRLVDGYNLEIQNVQTQDAGDYVCQIATIEPLELIHTVEILVPPRISQVTSGGTVEVKKGLTVTLECKADGNPKPTITWTRKNNILPSGEKSSEGPSITIEQANRHHAGIYHCTASNGVGQSAIRDIHLQVLYPPEIEVERGWVHSGEGYEAQLVCIVHADPPADVIWYRDTLRLDTTERRIMEVRGSRHTLIIRKVQSNDFGNYSCLADNNIGKTRQHLEPSGKPNPAIFRSHSMGRSRDSYNLTWTVNSYTPIEEFKLFFRKVPGSSLPHSPPQNQYQHAKRPQRMQENDTHGQVYLNGHQKEKDWEDVILPAIISEQYTQQMSYLIKNLEPASQYEAKVQAKNRFGWNQFSEIFHFTTRGIGGLESPSQPAVFTEPEMRDLGVKTFGTASVLNAKGYIVFTLAFIIAGRWT